MNLDQQLQHRREECRRDVLAWLAQRAPLAFRASRVRECINRNNSSDYSQEEIVAALAFRRGMNPPEIERIDDRGGADEHYRATYAGQLK